MTFKPSKRTTDNLAGVHPNLIKVLMRAYAITTVDFGIVAKAVRTQAEQDALYAQGRNGNPGPIVTWTRESKHIIQADGYGHAIDFVAFVGSQLSWDEKLYYPIADAIKTAAKELGISIRCGIDWQKKDYGHVELA